MHGLSHVLVLALVLSQAAEADKAKEYREYVGRNADRSLEGQFGFGGVVQPLKLVVKFIEREDRGDEIDGLMGMGSRVVHGCRISEGGETASFYITSLSVKGGGGKFRNADDWKRLQELIAKLPDDREELPPPNRRVIVQVREGDGWKNRIYDRANAPDEVLEVLRLTVGGLISSVGTYSPSREIDVHNWYRHGFLCLSPDGKSLVSSNGEELKFIDVETRKIVKALPLPRGVSGANECILSPDGKHAVVTETGLSGMMVFDTTKWEKQKQVDEPTIARSTAILTVPHFTSDGTRLLLHSTRPRLVVLNTKTWEHVEGLPTWPEGAVALYASDDRAIYSNAENVVALWDVAKNKLLTKLDDHGRLHRAAFSPDRSLVVAATHHQGAGNYWNTYRIRIWKTATGELLHELRPYEQRVCEDVPALMWTADGRYVLAATKHLYSPRNVGVWSVASGRHRAEFVGNHNEFGGAVLLPGEKTLMAGGDDGKVRFWDAAAAFKQIEELERSLTKK